MGYVGVVRMPILAIRTRIRLILTKKGKSSNSNSSTN